MPTRDRRLALADLADRDWIVNSRNTADEDAVKTVTTVVP